MLIPTGCSTPNTGKLYGKQAIEEVCQTDPINKSNSASQMLGYQGALQQGAPE
jgi:hypothetical protein